MIQNQIHEILAEISEQQGWNSESERIHLCGFLQLLVDDNTKTSNSDVLLRHWREYLERVADEENQNSS